MEYEKCYVFQPVDTRPTKRRRTEPTGLQASWNLRQKTYQKNWGAVKDNVESVLDKINSDTVSAITTFLDETSTDPEKISTGIILGGPNASSQNALIKQIARAPSPQISRVYLSLTSGDGSSLKTILKALITKATSQQDQDNDEENDDLPMSTTKGPKLLNYDLQILYNFVLERSLQQVVVSFEDTEAFDGELLSELIELMGCWLDRIPFVCLFSIATSLEFLQQRLFRDAIRCLNGRLFDVAPSGDEAEQVFEAIINTPSPLWLGPNLCSMILERQSDYIQSISSMIDATQYAYMSAWYANALTIFLDNDLAFEDIPSDHFDALRMLDSFKNAARALLEEGETAEVQELLDSNEHLYGFLEDKLASARMKLNRIMSVIDLIRAVQEGLPGTPVSSESSLYIHAMSGRLATAASLRAMLLLLRKSASNTLMPILTTLLTKHPSHPLVSTLRTLQTSITYLLTTSPEPTAPLRTEDDFQNSTLRTTIIAQKIHLSKQKSTLSPQDTEYTTLLRTFTTTLETWLKETLIDPKTLPFHEIFLYDSGSPYKEVFTPRPRHAVERALAAPGDYLGCECCAPDSQEQEATLSSTQPPTAVLYQLYLESGALINAADLWHAFQAVMGGDDAQEGSEEKTMALFQRGLAELKYLGMVKGTRKRADHVAKVAWRGL